MDIKRETINPMPIRAIREAKKLTRPQVRQMTGIAERTLFDIEAGKSVPDSETILSLAKAYSTSIHGIYEALGFDLSDIPEGGE